MARVRMVTRTVVSTAATVLCVNKETREVTEMVFLIPYTVPVDKICKYLSKTTHAERFYFADVVATETSEVLYGMPEEDFIRLAQILPPRTTNGAVD